MIGDAVTIGELSRLARRRLGANDRIAAGYALSKLYRAGFKTAGEIRQAHDADLAERARLTAWHLRPVRELLNG